MANNRKGANNYTVSPITVGKVPGGECVKALKVCSISIDHYMDGDVTSAAGRVVVSRPQRWLSAAVMKTDSSPGLASIGRRFHGNRQMRQCLKISLIGTITQM
ncbi:hypothetical protein EVAR_28231_1 [Eumeta japonica]|uniref:Uncharacterized protein n=1 Tax=Eumeta variegata TaxID=151549 RepID=A0A4C1V5K0_EUMVA|nr:hypothetical protein EVAR_28231_1 [Eumeta japonica]